LATAGDVAAAILLNQALYKKLDLTMALNGVLVVVAVPMLDKLKIDDVAGAIRVHLVFWQSAPSFSSPV